MQLEVPERDFLRAGYFWMGLAVVVALPWIGPSWLGQIARWVIVLGALVHVGEAFYAQDLARRRGLDPDLWLRRGLVLGFLAVRVLQRAEPPAATPTAPTPSAPQP